MTEPLVSVAVPLYNKAPFIAGTIESALAQTFTDFEIVVVDDGSTDDGAARLRPFADPRLKVIRQDNAGVAVARTRAMREGRGTYVAFLDGDDIWHPDHLGHLLELPRRFPQAALFGNDFAERSGDGGPLKSEPGRPVQYRVVDYFAECAFGRAPFYTSSCMSVRQRALDLGGFPVGKYCGEDLALWMLLAADAPVAVSDFVGCYYRRGIDSLSKQPSYRNAVDVSMSTLEDILVRHPEWPESRRSSVKEYYFRIALAHGLDCVRASEIAYAKDYLRLSRGTRMWRRRLWEARLLAFAPAPLREMFFRLADRRRV